MIEFYVRIFLFCVRPCSVTCLVIKCARLPKIQVSNVIHSVYVLHIQGVNVLIKKSGNALLGSIQKQKMCATR